MTLYYVLHSEKRKFVTRKTAYDVAVYLLGKSIDDVVIFKAIPEIVGAKIYVPSDGDVNKIEKELEALQ